MRLQANWAGTIARLGTRTCDGRVIAVPTHLDVALERVPVPVMINTIGLREVTERLPVRIGTAVEVSVEGDELKAAGTIDLRSAYYHAAAAVSMVDELFVAVELTHVQLHEAVDGLITQWKLSAVAVSLDAQLHVWPEPCVIRLDWRDGL